MIRLIIDIDSLGVYDVATNASQIEILNDNCPALIQAANRSQLQQQKWLHIEFETNPVNEKIDYRIQALAQSLEITYDVVLFTRKSLISIF